MDWKARGYRRNGKPGAGGMSDEEKAERRRVIENNKAWESAEAVRRDWLKTLLARKTAPKNAMRFIAYSIGNNAYTVADGITKHSAFTAELLGAADKYGELAKITAKPTGRHDMTILAAVLAGYEKSLTRASWRDPRPSARYYLNQLDEWGYTLSEVEQIITTETPEQ